MNLCWYKSNEMEEMICKKYRDNGIFYPSDLEIDRVATIYRADVATHKKETKTYWEDDFAVIYLNAFLNELKKREDFFHEISHLILHIGNQYRMPELYMKMQEDQADQCQLYCAMPYFMLHDYKYIENKTTYIDVLSKEFRLPIQFVQKRINQIERRILQAKLDEEFRSEMTPSPIEYDYSPETKRILAQLHRQIQSSRERKRNGKVQSRI
ncbi:ImmA/IrrE family metallo-endopeptidase [Paenibacillus mesophilus]|uniref:ImmA/IrrE family metallo-endopeptidase n=1 Tax=Paenibacillus mesophilus TaxID=2582849 RepID=UPI00110F28EE|nr:ImmA/IrrE family metallo-endopeptidase [Paenibacillus mesophilus]TMV49403.1 ImmA/IrrE family metallo-endopeptidase [Paenibacillus mesophilus]